MKLGIEILKDFLTVPSCSALITIVRFCSGILVSVGSLVYTLYLGLATIPKKIEIRVTKSNIKDHPAVEYSNTQHAR
jgi:hypothetical protein